MPVQDQDMMEEKMSEKITLKVNGRKKTIEIAGWEKLIDVIREDFEMTGTKRGCDDASCGACTVIVNGEAKRSCVLPAKKYDGAEIVTVEGLANGTDLHPIQTALIEEGAVQCGYCIPGIVMELCVLYTNNLDASLDEIKDALEKHFCRCTGYEAILNGALLAQKYMKEGKK